MDGCDNLFCSEAVCQVVILKCFFPENWLLHSRGVNSVNILAVRRWHEFVVDKKAGWLGPLAAVGSREVDREICHFCDCWKRRGLAVLRVVGGFALRYQYFKASQEKKKRWR